jgi:S1-C subfamily serine protease
VVPGDVIVSINDERVDNTADFQRIVARFRAGQQVRLRFLRDEEDHEVMITLQGV